MWRIACVAAVGAALIAAVALAAGGGRSEPRPAPQAIDRTTGVGAASARPEAPIRRPSARGRPEAAGERGDRRSRSRSRQPARERSRDRRETTAGAGPEADRMRREALRRHAERMREDDELRRPNRPECEVPDAFDAPGCAPR